MGFNSVDIVQGEDYTSNFYVKTDDGIFNRDMFSASGTYEILRLDDNSHVLTRTLVLDTSTLGFHKAIFNLSGADSNRLLEQTVEGAEDQYAKRSGYYGKIVLNNVTGITGPVLSVINKIRVI